MPNEFIQKFRRIISGEIKYTSSSLALNLLIARLQKQYIQNKSESEMAVCIKEVEAFAEKYASLMVKEYDAMRTV